VGVTIMPFWITLGIAFVVGVIVGALFGAMVTFILIEERK